MYRTNKSRLTCLEATMLESQLARLQAHYRTLAEADLNLILEIADGQNTGVWLREYSAEEIATFERHCDFLATIPDHVHKESGRRILAELLADGKITRAEIIERWGPDHLP